LKSLKRRDNSKDLGIVGRIILKWILGELGRSVWIHLAQGRDHGGLL
jgi:hypothetical protein